MDMDLYREVVMEQAELWTGDTSDWVLNRLMEKTLAELKCRYDKTHEPQDYLGAWQKNETHLAEHRPYLNNVATALRREICQLLLTDFTDYMGMIFHPLLAEDMDDDGESEQYDAQPFLEEVDVFNRIHADLGSAELPGPTKPGGQGIPYDVMEFVPVFPTVNFRSRLERLKSDLVGEITRAEGYCPRADRSILGNRTRDEYWRNENFVDRTLEMVIQLLALDPGLTRVRMLEIGRLFHSLILEPWYQQYGRRFVSPLGGDTLPAHEAENLRLRNAIIELDTQAWGFELQRLPGWTDKWWTARTFAALRVDWPVTEMDDIEQVQAYALNNWRRFYSRWLQILANAELTRTKLTQEQLDSENLKMCPICADDYEVGHIANCPVWIECPNSHTLCIKCYTQLSLTPTKPYDSLVSTHYCPQCRGELEYETDMRDLTEGLGLMPSLRTDFPYGTISEESGLNAPGSGSNASGSGSNASG